MCAYDIPKWGKKTSGSEHVTRSTQPVMHALLGPMRFAAFPQKVVPVAIY